MALSFSPTIARRHFVINDTHDFSIVKLASREWHLIIRTREGVQAYKGTHETRDLAIAVARQFDELPEDVSDHERGLEAVRLAYNLDFERQLSFR